MGHDYILRSDASRINPAEYLSTPPVLIRNRTSCLLAFLRGLDVAAIYCSIIVRTLAGF